MITFLLANLLKIIRFLKNCFFIKNYFFMNEEVKEKKKIYLEYLNNLNTTPVSKMIDTSFLENIDTELVLFTLCMISLCLLVYYCHRGLDLEDDKPFYDSDIDSETGLPITEYSDSRTRYFHSDGRPRFRGFKYFNKQGHPTDELFDEEFKWYDSPPEYPSSQEIEFEPGYVQQPPLLPTRREFLSLEFFELFYG